MMPHTLTAMAQRQPITIVVMTTVYFQHKNTTNSIKINKKRKLMVKTKVIMGS